MMGMLHDMQALLGHVEEMEEGLENDMSLNSGDRCRIKDEKHILGLIE